MNEETNTIEETTESTANPVKPEANVALVAQHDVERIVTAMQSLIKEIETDTNKFLVDSFMDAIKRLYDSLLVAFDVAQNIQGEECQTINVFGEFKCAVLSFDKECEYAILVPTSHLIKLKDNFIIAKNKIAEIAKD